MSAKTLRDKVLDVIALYIKTTEFVPTQVQSLLPNGYTYQEVWDELARMQAEGILTRADCVRKGDRKGGYIVNPGGMLANMVKNTEVKREERKPRRVRARKTTPGTKASNPGD